MKQFRKTILILSALIFPLLSFSQKEVYLFSYFTGNGEDGLHLLYSRDGLKWEKLNEGRTFLRPEVGISKLMRDPCIILTKDGTFHMVWTAGWTESGIGYASSKDLISWSEQKYIEVMAHEPAARNCWAPEIIYDEKEGLFLIYWSTTITGRFPETTAKEEKAYNHRIYCTTTSDFITFSETRLFYEPGFNVIDATIVRDGRKYIMFLKDETVSPVQKNIKMARSVSLYGPYGEASLPLTGSYWAEGPTAIRIGKEWIVYFDKYREHKYGAVRSGDLEKWDDISELIAFPPEIRHGTVLKIPEESLNLLLASGNR